mmetsp:Transcript_4102/g.12860  ORF Transcript_4102/g.12860 Transcript_4102/m.12860 type:complete len:205 (-) Transcript_4102:52-666(-)
MAESRLLTAAPRSMKCRISSIPKVLTPSRHSAAITCSRSPSGSSALPTCSSERTSLLNSATLSSPLLPRTAHCRKKVLGSVPRPRISRRRRKPQAASSRMLWSALRCPPRTAASDLWHTPRSHPEAVGPQSKKPALSSSLNRPLPNPSSLAWSSFRLPAGAPVWEVFSWVPGTGSEPRILAESSRCKLLALAPSWLPSPTGPQA